MSTSSPLLLLVDDYEDSREMTADYLRSCDFRVASAANGLEAVENAQALAPSLILLDLTLPVLDGWGAIELLREHPATRAIPIVAMSGQSNANVGSKARSAGCAGYLEKPCSPRDVVVEVNRVLGRASAAPPTRARL